MTEPSMSRPDPVLHAPDRLPLLAACLAVPVSFSELKRRTNLTDGALAFNLKELEKAAYIASFKKRNSLVRRGEETFYGATRKGEKAFDAYLGLMRARLDAAEQILKDKQFVPTRQQS